MRQLNGSEIAGFIKERQAHAVRNLRQELKIIPKLAIVYTVDNPVIDVYMRMKKKYGADILVDVDIHKVAQNDVAGVITELNEDDTVHGIIVQLPLADPEETDSVVNLVDPKKDVDALGKDAKFDPATPMAILWLLAGYNIDLNGKNILLIGKGKLVGAPLEKILLAAGHTVKVVNRSTPDVSSETLQADVVISATGVASLIHADMLKPGTVVVDAGVASEGGKTTGDLAPDVYDRDDLMVTPQKGGVGPLTVCALFDNVIRAANESKQ